MLGETYGDVELLFAILGELASRELSLKTGRHSVWSPRWIGGDRPLAIPGELDLCVHLPLDFAGTRGALLLRAVDADRLETQARKRGTLTRPPAPELPDDRPLLRQLLEGVLARPCALLGFLCDQPYRLRGLNVQALSTPAQRALHEIAFTRQGLVQADLPLLLHGLDAMPTALLLPPDLCAGAATALSDPGRIQVTESEFLERAPELRRGLATWVGEQTGQEGAAGEDEGDEGDGPSLPGDAVEAQAHRDGYRSGRSRSEWESDGPGSGDEAGIDALLAALTGAQSDEGSAEGEEEVVLRAPEDLVFAQMFFPRNVATATRQKLGLSIHVRAVEMAAVPLRRMCLEPPGQLLRVAYIGQCDANTCFVFPEARLATLAARAGLEAMELLDHLLSPGARLLQGRLGLLLPWVLDETRVDFSRYRPPRGGHTIRIAYEMTVDGEEPVAFVQYAPTAFVNQLVSELAGEGVDLLKGSLRNLMLGFLSLNALLGACALEDPQRAAAWLSPVLGDELIPVTRPGESIPDVHDFDPLAALPGPSLRELMHSPNITRHQASTVAAALTLARRETRDAILAVAATAQASRLGSLLRRAEARPATEVWKCARAFAGSIYCTLINGKAPTPPAMQPQVDWYARRLKLEWRVRGREVLKDPAYVIPPLLDFQSLAELSDRDLRMVLERPRVLAVEPEKLARALSAPGCKVRPRVLRNVSEVRRAAIAPHINESTPPEEIRHEQLTLSQHVYFTLLEDRIEPPPSVRAQIDAYLELVNDELRQWSRGVLHDRTFGRVLAALTEDERRQVHKLVGRQGVLWALQEAPAEVLALFLDDLSEEGRDRLRGDLAHAGAQAATADERLWRTAAARLTLVDAARVLVALRTRPSRSRG